MKKIIKNYVFFIIIAFYLISFFLYPNQITASVSGALDLCANIVIPSLFPFFVLSSLFIKSGLCEKIGHFLSPALTPLFNLSSACVIVFVLSLISGYPAGGIGAVTLYQEKGCTKQECERLLAFCNNCGPAFIITAIGSIMLDNYQAGVLLYITHIAGAALVGIIFGRFYKKKKIEKTKIKHNNDIKITDIFIESIDISLKNMLNVCAAIITFCVFISILNLSGILSFFSTIINSLFKIPPGVTTSVLTGLIELTNGSRLLTLSGIDPASMLVILSLIIGFGGICVHIQLLAAIRGENLNMKYYFIGKTAQAVISGILTFAFLGYINKTSLVFKVFDKNPAFEFFTSIFLFLALVFILTIFAYIFYKKNRQNV